MKSHQSTTDDSEGKALAFLAAACAPRGAGHGTGTLDGAEAIRAAHPEVARSSIHAAAVVGDDEAVREFLAGDPAQATATGGPYEWDPLTYLCFSRYLRLDPARSDAFVRAATALLDAGASPNSGWFEEEHQPHPEWESVLYGAAGVAHHAPLTRLLLERGADPNDGEVVYHAPETRDNEALRILVESGRLTTTSLTTILLRKTDWHDLEAIRLLLARGVDPNQRTQWGHTAIHGAIRSDNMLEIIELLVEHGADPWIAANGMSAVALAARRGRRDVLELFDRRGIPTELSGVDRLIAACARADGALASALAAQEPRLVRELLAEGGTLIAQFASTGNAAGIEQLLALGVPVDERFREGSGYHSIAPHSTALHVAAWKAWHETVRFLVARGADVGARDAKGETPLRLAVRACVDSYWTVHPAPDSVAILLAAGASPAEAPYPCGYADVDRLLREYGAGA